jgi:hypothetical protein
MPDLPAAAVIPAQENAMQDQFSALFHEFTSTQLIVAAVVLVALVGIAIAAYVVYRRTRTRNLRNRFGSEYDRAVITHGSSSNAEAKLADRQTRVKALDIRDLSATERDRFLSEWQTVQSRFVDHPKAAVTEADDLVNSLLEARGYPTAGFDQRAADVSVTYPRVMENYRVAHGIAVRPGRVEATTEELRTAMIQYRAIFDELAQAQKPIETRNAA